MKCHDNDALYHDCDEAFIIECENVQDGDFTCTSHDGDPPNCISGKCEFP